MIKLATFLILAVVVALFMPLEQPAHATAVFVGHDGNLVTGSATTISVTITTAPSADDVMVVGCWVKTGGSNQAITVPSGFGVADINQGQLAVFTLVADGTEGTTVTCTSGESSNEMGIVVWVWDGLNTADLIDQTSTASTNASSITIPATPAIENANNLALCITQTSTNFPTPEQPMSFGGTATVATTQRPWQRSGSGTDTNADFADAIASSIGTISCTSGVYSSENWDAVLLILNTLQDEGPAPAPANIFDVIVNFL